MRFKTHYRGKLTDGFFDNEIDPPQGTVFSDGKPRKWSPAPDTLEDMYPNTKGKLNGYINQPPSEWSWGIPDDAPLGKYQIYMRVHSHLGINNRPVMDEKEETITVIPRSEKLEKSEAVPTHGITIVEIMEPELIGVQPLDATSLPTSGWIGVKVVNDSEIGYKGCLAKVKTNAGEFPLYDRQEYLRNVGTGNPNLTFNLFGHETKRLYSNITANTAKVTVIIDIGKETIQKSCLCL